MFYMGHVSERCDATIKVLKLLTSLFIGHYSLIYYPKNIIRFEAIGHIQKSATIVVAVLRSEIVKISALRKAFKFAISTEGI